MKSIVGGIALALLAAAPAQAQLPSVSVRATTFVMPNFGAHRGVTVTAGCADGSKLVGGGGYLRNATNPATLPTNGLVLGGTLPSTGAMPVDAPAADQALDISHWTSIANFTGQSEAGDQAATFALCATSGGPAQTIVATKSTTGINATQEVNPPNITTATCPQGSRLISGGAMTRTPDQINDGTTAGNNGNLKPLGNYPSDAAGLPAADGSTDATSWSAYGSAGVPSAGDEVTAFALCSVGAETPAVRVARVDYTGPDAQPGTTLIASPVSCPASTRLLGGGYKVDESVGATNGLQPQQGYHMRGSYPTTDATGTSEAADGATNLTTWTSLVQAGGQNLSAGKHMNLRGFAMCAVAPAAAPDLALSLSATPSPVVVGDDLTYTLTLANPGGDATGVELKDVLPAGVTFVSADNVGCTHAAGTVTCSIGALAAGASVTVKIVATATTAGSTTNAAQATLDGTDATPANNTADVTVAVLSAPRAHPTLSAQTPESARIGEAITGRATLAAGDAPTGTVTFMVYGPGDGACANALATSDAAVSGGGDSVSAPFTPAEAGTYRWTATYAGDAANEPAGPTGCGDASVQVRAVPALTLTATGSAATLGATATLAGGSALGGAVTFSVYGPADVLCATPLATSTVAVAGNGSYAAPTFAAPGPGTYRWIASYGGDDRNTAAGPTDCAGAPVAVAAVIAAPPRVVTTAPAPKPSSAFTIPGTRADRSGRLRLTVRAPGAGTFVATARANGSTYGRVTRSLTKAGRVTLTLKPGANGKRALRRHTRLRVTVTVTFTPKGGTPRTRKAAVTIRRS